MTTALQRVLSLAVLAAAVSCQTYDFEPVTPLAIAQTTQKKTVTAVNLKPDLMILLDKSGSMSASLPGGTGCGNCAFPTCNEAQCPTRMGSLRTAMQTFLTASGDVARMGLTIFPADNVCTAAGANQQLTAINPANDMPQTLMDLATAINNQIQTQTVGGGTPTGNSLAFVGTLPELNNPMREDFVLLLTDGLPNCNTMNPNTCTAPTTCKCTLNGGMCGTTVNDGDPNNFCRRGCLDLDGSVQAVKDLRQREIKTIVVGFGSDFGSGDGFNVLNAMAIAGGFQRVCPLLTDAECGTGNVCETGTQTCRTAFYSAANATELAAALAQISANIGGQSICTFTLDATPSNADLVSVIIDGVAQQSGPDTWELMAGKIIMKGALCTKIQASNPTNPVKVEIRIVQSL